MAVEPIKMIVVKFGVSAKFTGQRCRKWTEGEEFRLITRLSTVPHSMLTVGQ